MSQSATTARFAKNLAALRKSRGISARALSEKLREKGLTMPRSVIANLESGYRENVTLDEVVAIADLLGADLPAMWQQPVCGTCCGSPPPGFACLACGSKPAPASPPPGGPAPRPTA